MIQTVHSDCLDHMRSMAAGSVDAIVSDPPYGLSFMGKDWDHGVPGKHFWEEALRVAKPGAHLLAFGGTRTFHRLAVAIEDAGWEIRDTLMWVYGSGFPKSHDVSKAIDRDAGVERAVVGEYMMPMDSTAPGRRPSNFVAYTPGVQQPAGGIGRPITTPSTDAAKQWQGWGTALKPAWEPIIMARKPLEGTVAMNVQAHGTGAINVDGCRVVVNDADAKHGSTCTRGTGGVVLNVPSPSKDREPLNSNAAKGRWPANVIHDGSEEVLKHFPKEAGSYTGTPHRGDGRTNKGRAFFGGFLPDKPWEGIKDNSRGSAARFFYCAKASREDRNAGLDSLELVTIFGTWEQEDRVVRLLVDTDPSAPRVIEEYAAQKMDGCAWSTLLFGSAFMDQFQQECRSTTSTGASSTTGSKTLNALARCITSGSIPGVNFAQTDGGSHAASVANGTTLILTTSERTASALGVESAQLPTQLRISAGEGQNIHSTVKPTALMRYLCRLVTPPNGVVFDPFMGSGSTGKAAVLEGFSFIGCDLQEEYVKIASARIEHAERQRIRDEGLFAA